MSGTKSGDEEVTMRAFVLRARWAVLAVGLAWTLAGCPGGDGSGGSGGGY
jgi:hypothetical protein